MAVIINFSPGIFFCPSQLNSTLLLILISSISCSKKDLRLLLLVDTARAAPTHLLLPSCCYCPRLFHFIIHSTHFQRVSINFVPGLLLKRRHSKWTRCRRTVHCQMSATATQMIIAQCERYYNRGMQKHLSTQGSRS
jgi:hypothetical protein